MRRAVEIAKAYAQSGENKHGPLAEFIEIVYKKFLDLRKDVIRGEKEG